MIDRGGVWHLFGIFALNDGPAVFVAPTYSARERRNLGGRRDRASPRAGYSRDR